MIPELITDNQRLVTGRAGELTRYANIITFDLLERIFGFNGPYRDVLKKYGTYIKDNDNSFLVLRDGIVYTDLDKEEKILWSMYPITLIEKSGEVVHKFTWSKTNPVTLVNYLQKVIYEGLLVTNVDRYVNEAHNAYKEVSLAVKEVYKNGSITPGGFLEIYEKIVSVSYLYEFLYLYNGSRSPSTLTKHYVEENDYLIAGNTQFIEYELKLPNGFYLDDYKDLKAVNPQLPNFPFIPDVIKRVPTELGLTKLQGAEKELQCLKNNLRLKTNILLYFLNVSAIEGARKKGFDSIFNRKLYEIFL